MPTRHKSFELRYVGARFAGKRLPVELLSDLSAFRDLVAAFSKDKWRHLNAHRQRLPKGFDKSISFDLVGLEDGSAVPKLDWRRELAQEMLPDFADEVEELVGHSYSDVLELLDGVGREQFPAALSSEHIHALNRLGAGLVSGERIEFLGSKGFDGNVVYLDATRRKALITRVRETYQTRYEDIGTLVGLHLDGRINVETERFGELSLPVDPARIHDEFDGSTGSSVQFSLQIELDNRDSIRGVIEVYDVDLIDAELSGSLERCRQRLEEISCLKHGWHEGAGEPVLPIAAGLAKLLLSKRPLLAGGYRIYPTEAGGVLFEFIANNWDLSVEISNSGFVEFYGVKVDGPDELTPLRFQGLTEEFFQQYDEVTGRMG